MELTINEIDNKIYTIRGVQVMLDRDLALLYEVETKHINQAVRNNQDKLQEDFVFQLNDKEFNSLQSNNLTTNFSKTRINPKVFTEQGENRKKRVKSLSSFLWDFITLLGLKAKLFCIEDIPIKAI
jgi:hypothetical protein